MCYCSKHSTETLNPTFKCQKLKLAVITFPKFRLQKYLLKNFHIFKFSHSRNKVLFLLFLCISKSKTLLKFDARLFYELLQAFTFFYILVITFFTMFLTFLHYIFPLFINQKQESAACIYLC